MEDAIVCQAILYKLQTTVDHGWRVTFDLDLSQSELITQLSRLSEKVLTLVITDATKNV